MYVELVTPVLESIYLCMLAFKVNGITSAFIAAPFMFQCHF
jgi:hypothetical protein